jgi:tight adherence protein C
LFDITVFSRWLYNPVLLLLAAVGLLAAIVLLMITNSEVSLAGRKSTKDEEGEQETVFGKRLKARVEKDQKKEELKLRLIHAGLYRFAHSHGFRILQVVLIFVPAALGWLVANKLAVSSQHALLAGLVCGVAGKLAPSFWLDHLKAKRQMVIRRSLPDALDVVNICLEGGISLPSALARVSQELSSAHPELAIELAIVVRETRLGRSVSESLKACADRFDLEELRTMASVISQSERFGASLSTAMTVFADSMRIKRMTIAETKAQQAVIKVIFPTLFCIFPVLYAVLLGPAALRVMNLFAE